MHNLQQCLSTQEFHKHNLQKRQNRAPIGLTEQGLTNYILANEHASTLLPLQQEKSTGFPSLQLGDIKEKLCFHWSKTDTPCKEWRCSQRTLSLGLVLLAEGAVYDWWGFFLYSKQSFPILLNTDNLRQKKRRTSYPLHSSASHTYTLPLISESNNTKGRICLKKKVKKAGKYPKGNEETPHTSLLQKRRG